MKIKQPKGLKGVNGKKPIAVADIVPFLPHEDCFFDSRHWICEPIEGGVLPFALTTRVDANHQQYLRVYQKQDNNDGNTGNDNGIAPEPCV